MVKNSIRKIVIAGGGAAGWMSAAVLSKALGPHVSIELVESDEIGIVGVGEATIPQIQLINRFLAIDENDFLRRTGGTFKLGIEFTDWGRKGDRYIHAFGDIGFQLGLLPFHHYWLRARSEDHSNNLWDFSLNAKAAYAQKFARLDRIGETPLGGIKYAFHFDAALYAAELRRQSEARGVRRTEGKIAQVARDAETGMITALHLDGERSVEGELFIDCTGFRSLLLGQALEEPFESWARWLPCDRAVAVAAAHGDDFKPYTQSMARDAGWQWRIPLQHRVGNGHVYCSDFLSDDEASRQLLSNLEGAPLADPRQLKFRAGMRRRLWVKNCVAIGLASGFLEPLESTSIHLIQSVISRLVSMFPDNRFDESMIAEFNRQSAFEYERIRDFIILHYKATTRDDTPFWRQCRDMDIPDTLKDKIELFRSSGRIYREHEELFTEVGWLQVMIGQGIAPHAYHPVADVLPEPQLQQFLGDVKRLTDAAANQLPAHSDFIRQHCAAPHSDAQ